MPDSSYRQGSFETGNTVLSPLYNVQNNSFKTHILLPNRVQDYSSLLTVSTPARHCVIMSIPGFFFSFSLETEINENVVEIQPLL